VAEFANQPSLSIENMHATPTESESKWMAQDRRMQATRPEPLLWVCQIAEVRHRMNDQLGPSHKASIKRRIGNPLEVLLALMISKHELIDLSLLPNHFVFRNTIYKHRCSYICTCTYTHHYKRMPEKPKINSGKRDHQHQVENLNPDGLFQHKEPNHLLSSILPS
jgi:hypothetical protein